MNKPMIGVTPSHDTQTGDISMRPTYLRAVAAAGGIPVVLPLEGSAADRRQLLSLCDGVLFTGGPDLHPFLFGEDTHKSCGNVSLARDSFEMALLKLAMEEKKPILGVCRGLQLINVALGGDLYQDLPTQFSSDFPIAHKQPFHYTTMSHFVDVVPGTRLAAIAGERASIQVNSMHHQAIRRLAPALTASGFSRDGLTEAVELRDYPWLTAVQWHPEYLWETDETAAGLFSEFVKACAQAGSRI